jgi:hypothetical protein
MASTLVTVASVTALAGTTLGVVDSLYSGNQYLQKSQEAIALRASALSHNGDLQTDRESKERLDEAWSDLTSAGISAVTILPFGSIWRVMSKSAQVSKIGSVARLGELSAKEEAQALKNLSQTIRELNNPQLEKILVNARSQVSAEDYGSFIGQLSQLSKEQREIVIEKMLLHPNKVSEAMIKGAKAGREACR